MLSLKPKAECRAWVIPAQVRLSGPAWCIRCKNNAGKMIFVSFFSPFFFKCEWEALLPVDLGFPPSLEVLCGPGRAGCGTSGPAGGTQGSQLQHPLEGCLAIISTGIFWNILCGLDPEQSPPVTLLACGVPVVGLD